jgi:hypothetical protein
MAVMLAAGGLLSMPEAHQNASDAVRVFQRNVAKYVSLRDRLDRSLPPLDAKPTARQIDSRRDALLALLSTARVGTRKGDVFGAAMSDSPARVYGRSSMGRTAHRCAGR